MPTYFDTFIIAFGVLEPCSRLLDGDQILCPPEEDFGYQSTPRSALTFVSMGVDGVHDVILKLNGAVRDDSPIVSVSPMDPEDVFVVAETFLRYLADGCGVSPQAMHALFEAERAGKAQLVVFLAEHFNRFRLRGEAKVRELDEWTYALTAAFGHLIERKPNEASAAKK